MNSNNEQQITQEQYSELVTRIHQKIYSVIEGEMLGAAAAALTATLATLSIN